MGLKKVLKGIRRAIVPGQDQIDNENAPVWSENYPDQPPVVYNPPPPPPQLTSPPPEQPAVPVYEPAAAVSLPDSPPPPTMADRAMAKAVPMEDATRARLVGPAPATPAGAQVIYQRKNGQDVPTGAQGGADELERNQAYLNALNAYSQGGIKSHNSRFKSALIQFGRNYLHGGGLAGAIVGGIQGAVDPAVDERYQNEVDIAKTSRAVTQEQASRKAASDLQNEAVERNYKGALAQRALYPVYEPKVLETDEGFMNVSPGQSKATPIFSPKGTPLQGKEKPENVKYEVRHNSQTGKAEKWQLGSEGHPDKKVEGWADTNQNLVKTPKGRWVSQGAAETAEAIAGEGAWRHNRATVQDTQRAEDKTQARIDKAGEKKKDAGRLTGAIDGAQQATMQADAKIANLKPRLAAETNADRKQALQESLDGWEFERTKAVREATDAATQLGSAHSDLYETGKDQYGFPTYKIRPWSHKQWRVKYPKATKAQEDADMQTAQEMGMPIVP